MKKLIASACLMTAMTFGGAALTFSFDAGMANAQEAPSDAGVAVDAGTVTPDAPPRTHEDVPLPHEDPGEFVDELEKTKSRGWLGVVLIGLYGVLRSLGLLALKYEWLDFLNKGKTAMIIASAGTMLAAAVDVFFLGGTLVSILMAMLWAGVGLIVPTKKPVPHVPGAA